MSKYFLFLDGETTGLDPSSDALLELAWFLTNDQLEIISEPRTFAVHIDEGHTLASLSAMNDFVRNMHTTTGLLEDLEDGATLDYIFATLVSDIEEYVALDDTLHIAGLSIHFDVDFLKANDFNLFSDIYPHKAKIHHRHLDLSSVKLLFSTVPGLTEHIGAADPGGHRALADCYEALTYARMVRGTLTLAFPFPPVAADEAVTAEPSITVESVADDSLIQRHNAAVARSVAYRPPGF
jgi:oligoribonuclease